MSRFEPRTGLSPTPIAAVAAAYHTTCIGHILVVACANMGEELLDWIDG